MEKINAVEKLLQLNVNKHVEKKNGLSYLSWSWAWDQALRADPSANFQVSTWTKDDGTTQCYMEINDTAMVWVSVTMLGQTRTCMLPVMNAKNDPISITGRKYTDKYGKEKIEKVDAFTVNTAIMRCMTKCLALFGLGLYIYAGEDLPFDEENLTPFEAEWLPKLRNAALESPEALESVFKTIPSGDNKTALWAKHRDSLKEAANAAAK